MNCKYKNRCDNEWKCRKINKFQYEECNFYLELEERDIEHELLTSEFLERLIFNNEIFLEDNI